MRRLAQIRLVIDVLAPFAVLLYGAFLATDPFFTFLFFPAMLIATFAAVPLGAALFVAPGRQRIPTDHPKLRLACAALSIACAFAIALWMFRLI
jgi:hypothetical protein